MIYRDFFKTPQAAQDACAAAIARITALWSAAASAASAGEVTVAAPTIKTKITKIEALPVGAIPATSIPYSRVYMTITAIDGRAAQGESVMPTAQIDPALGGAFAITATVPATATVRLTIAQAVYVTNGYSGLNIPANAVFQDPISGKRYKFPATSMTASVVFIGSGIAEYDVTELGEVTWGTILVPVADATWGGTPPPAGMIATVLGMKSATIGAGTALTDPITGLSYQVIGTQSVTDPTGGSSGFATKDIPIKGLVPGAASIAVGESLAWGTKPAGISKVVVTKTQALVTVPKGTALTNSGNAFTYHLLGDVVVGDALTATGEFAPDAGIVSAKVALGSTMTIPSPPTGISPTGPVTAVDFAQLVPGDYAPQVIGDAPEWRSRVVPAGDGVRWLAEVYTVPYGS